MSSGIRRATREGNFDIVNRDTVRDKSLSYRARGVLMRLLSNADGFSMSASDLAREGKEGRDAILAALKELREKKYLLTRRFQNEKGHWGTENIIFDRPQASPENPTSVPSPEKPASVPQMPVFQSLKAGKAGVLKAAAAFKKIEDSQINPALRAGKTKNHGSAGQKIYFSDPKFGLLELQKGNERDLQTASLLLKNWGIQKINEAVSSLSCAGKRGFPSNVSKYLGPPPHSCQPSKFTLPPTSTSAELEMHSRRRKKMLEELGKSVAKKGWGPACDILARGK